MPSSVQCEIEPFYELPEVGHLQYSVLGAVPTASQILNFEICKLQFWPVPQYLRLHKTFGAAPTSEKSELIITLINHKPHTQSWALSVFLNLFNTKK